MNTFALGLGEIRVRSSLGQALLIKAEVVGAETENLNQTCLRARVVSMDGVFIASAHVVISQIKNRRSVTFSTIQAINEPAVKLIIDFNCDSQLHREFSILLDPVELTSNLPVAGKEDSPVVDSNAISESSPSSSSSPENIGAGKQAAKSQTPQRKSSISQAKVEQTEQLARKPKKRRASQQSTAAPQTKDVLQLSDDVIMNNSVPGLRMSDVLSMESGRELLGNMQELREAQAKMAAILRDEKPVDLAKAPKADDSLEIKNLKRETELLKKQNHLDKATLDNLKAKSESDYWVLILASIAIVAVLVVVYLLYYISRNNRGAKGTWWENEAADEYSEQKAPPPADSDIDDLLAIYRAVDDDSTHTAEAHIRQSNNARKKHVADIFEDDDNVSNVGGHSEQLERQRTPTLEETNSSIFNFFSPVGSSVKVEEISDITQEAEFWISMNDPQRAIEILASQEQIEHPDSPLPWLFLLDLYRTVNDREKYSNLRNRFVIFFNANIPEFDEDLTLVPQKHLEDFVHLVERICILWNSNEVIPVLESLIIDDREGKRAGFDLPVYRDILMLLGIAHELERLRAIENPKGVISPEMMVEVKPAAAPNFPIKRGDPVDTVDPVDEADFGTIEFEMIDFPRDSNKK